MYDFCFSPFYASTLALAGAYAYFTQGSLHSLGGGAAAGVLFSVLSQISYRFYVKRRGKCWPTVVLSIAAALGMTYFFYLRYEETQAKAPLILANVSLVMAFLYLFGLVMAPAPKRVTKTS